MLKGYRTYLVAVLVALFGFLAEVDWVKVIDDPKGGLGLIIGGALMAAMRVITTTPPGKPDVDTDPK